VRAVFDTNILIDHLNGIESAREELNRFTDRIVSIISWMEVMAGVRNSADEGKVRRFLNEFRTVPVEAAVAEQAVELRRSNLLKLPDAIIYATARNEGCLLVTRNTKDFSEEMPDVRVPYRV
jgi:predicted nucleic acid-binding protein